MKYIIYLLTFILITSCTTNNNSLIKSEKKIEIIDLIKTNEEKSFFNDNIIPKNRKGFYDVFFSYIEGNYDNFYKTSNLFMKDNKKPKVLKFWISLKYLNLFKKDIISYKDIKEFYLSNIELKFIAVLLKESELLYKQYFILENSVIKNFNLLSKWKVTGPYKTVAKKTLINFDLKNKYNSVFIENKELDFKNGGIVIPSDDYNIYGGVYKLSSVINVENEELNISFMGAKTAFILMIDDKIIFNNESFIGKKSREVISVKLKNGNHKLTMMLVNLNREFFLYTNTAKNSKGKIKTSSLYESLISDLYSLKKYSYSFKSLIAAELSMDFLNNTDEFYKYLTQIQKDNFYKDYLYYSFYDNFMAADKTVRNKNMQKYIKKSIKKNPDFYKTKMEYIVLLSKPNPYEVLSDLKDINPTKWYYKLKASYLKKANLLKEYRNTVNKIYKMKNGEIFLYKYLIPDLSLFDYDLYAKISQNLEKDLLYKTKYTQKDKDYILNEIKNAPYSRSSLDLLLELKAKDENIASNPVLKNFKSQKTYHDMDNSLKGLKELLNDKNIKNFVKANFFLKEWSKYIKFEDTKKIIKKFKTISEKESFPTTKLLDYDIAFIEKDYWILLNRRIIRINNSQGLRRYSTLKRNSNYLKLMTISYEDLKEYEPSFGDNTSEISLKKLKVGDFIELITYQISYLKAGTKLDKLISFRYKDFNQTVINGKLDLYISDYFAFGDKKLFINSKNDFNLSNIKSSKLQNHTLYQYRANNLKGIKSEPYSFRNGEDLFPMLVISGKTTWKDIYKQMQLFMDYLEYSYFSKDVIGSYGKIKDIKDLKELYFNLTENMEHTNQYYSYFDSTFLNKRGNLVYYLKMILDKNKIDSEILIFHSKYNFRDEESTPSYSYYSVFVLKVNLDKKTYYIDLSSKWSTMDNLPQYLYNQFYLRIDNDRNIFKEKLKPVKKLETKTTLTADLKDDGSAKINLKIEIPSYLASSLKGYLSMQTDDKINMIFNSFLAKKLGFVVGFKVNITGHKEIKAPLVINIDFLKSDFAQKEGNKLIISDFLNKEFATQLYNYATLKDYTMLPIRTLPLLLHYFNDNYVININYPEGYKTSKLNSITEGNKFAKYDVKVLDEKNSIKITRKYFIDINKVEIKDYDDLKKMAEKIKKFKSQDIIIEKK